MLVVVAADNVTVKVNAVNPAALVPSACVTSPIVSVRASSSVIVPVACDAPVSVAFVVFVKLTRNRSSVSCRSSCRTCTVTGLLSSPGLNVTS